MTPQTFAEWRRRQRLSKAAAGRLLGCSKNSIFAWETGQSPIPVYVALACAAIALGVPPHPDQSLSADDQPKE